MAELLRDWLLHWPHYCTKGSALFDIKTIFFIFPDFFQTNSFMNTLYIVADIHSLDYLFHIVLIIYWILNFF